MSSQSLSSSRDTSSLDSSSSSSDSDSAFLFLPAPLPRRPPATFSSSLSRLLSLSDILAGCCNVPGAARGPQMKSAKARWQRSTQQEDCIWERGLEGATVGLDQLERCPESVAGLSTAEDSWFGILDRSATT